MRRRLPWLIGAAVLAVVVVVGVLQAAETSTPTPKASPLTAAEVRARLEGSPPRLAALHRQAGTILPGTGDGLKARLRALRGHPVVVNVWASWCGPCLVELPVLQRASVAWGKRVAFLGVDLRDNRQAATKLLRKVPLSYPSYEDPDGTVATGYRLLGTPSTVFYDASGKQTYVHQGAYYTRAELDAQIRRYALGEHA